MERVSNQQFEDFPAATLYFDDLAEIVETFAGACKRIEVKAGEFKLTDAAELGSLASKFVEGRFPDIYIKGYDPYVTLDLRGFGASAYISEDSLEQRGVVAKVRELMQRRKRLRRDILVDLAAGLLLSTGIWLMADRKYDAWSVPLVAASALLFFPISLRLRMKGTVCVHTKGRHELNNFFQRKKDDVAFALISAAVGASVTYFFTKFVP